MKVIYKDNVENWTYECQCRICDSVLESNVDDVNYKDTQDYGISGFYSVKCIICDNHIIIPTDKIPKLLRIQIKKRL